MESEQSIFIPGESQMFGQINLPPVEGDALQEEENEDYAIQNQLQDMAGHFNDVTIDDDDESEDGDDSERSNIHSSVLNKQGRNDGVANDHYMARTRHEYTQPPSNIYAYNENGISDYHSEDSFADKQCENLSERQCYTSGSSDLILDQQGNSEDVMQQGSSEHIKQQSAEYGRSQSESSEKFNALSSNRPNDYFCLQMQSGAHEQNANGNCGSGSNYLEKHNGNEIHANLSYPPEVCAHFQNEYRYLNGNIVSQHDSGEFENTKCKEKINQNSVSKTDSDRSEHVSSVSSDGYYQYKQAIDSYGDSALLQNNNLINEIRDYMPPLISDNVKEDYLKLYALYNEQAQKLEEFHQRINDLEKDAEKKIMLYNQNLIKIQEENNNLAVGLKQSEQLVADRTQENNVLYGKVSALELQLNVERQAKQDVLQRLQSANAMIQSLSEQVTELTHSENLARAREQHENILRDLKHRHQKEIIPLKEKVDSLQQLVNSKTDEIEAMQQKIDSLEKRNDQLQMDKAEAINRLTLSLEASQRKNHELLESDAITEVSELRMNIKCIEGEKNRLLNENAVLKEELEKMKVEYKEQQNLIKLKLLYNEKFVDSKNNEKSALRKENDYDNVVSDLQLELKRALQDLQSHRTQNATLKNQLQKEHKEQLAKTEEIKALESQLEKMQKKANEAERKLAELGPEKMVSLIQYQKDINAVKAEKINVEKELQKVVIHSKDHAKQLEKLNEENKQLQVQLSQLISEHDNDLKVAVTKCEENFHLQREEIVKKLKQESEKNLSSHVSKVRSSYEKKISDLNQQINGLNENFLDVKTQHSLLIKEAESLRLEVKEKRKLCDELKQQLKTWFQKENDITEKSKPVREEEHKKNCDEELQKEISLARKEWEKEQESYISNIKQAYEAKFLEDYQKIIQEKKAISTAYEARLKKLQSDHQCEKISMINTLKDNVQQIWDREKNRLEGEHQLKLTEVKQQCEEKIKNMETAVLNKKELDSEFEQKIEEIQQEIDIYKARANSLAEAEGTLKDKLIAALETEKALKDKLASSTETEKQIREKLKKYYKQVQNLNKMLDEEKNSFTKQLLNMQRNYDAELKFKLKKLEEKHKVEISNLKENYSKLQSYRSKNQTDSFCQTEEKMVSQETAALIGKHVINGFNKAADEIKKCYNDLTKQTYEHLNQIDHQQQQTTTCRTATYRKLMEELNSYKIDASSPTTATKSSGYISSTADVNSEHLASAKPQSSSTPKFMALFNFNENNEAFIGQQKLCCDRNELENLLTKELNVSFDSKTDKTSEANCEFLTLPRSKSPGTLLKNALKLPTSTSSDSSNLSHFFDTCIPDKLSLNKVVKNKKS